MMRASADAWAVINEDGHVMWTRGGSSTNSRMMIYDTEGKAKGAIKRFLSVASYSQELVVKNLLASDADS